MRCRVTVAAEVGILPWEHLQAPGRDVIYTALRRTAPELAARLHDRGIDSRGRTPFSYSTPVFPDVRRVHGQYRVGGRGHWDIASPLPEVMQALAGSLAVTPDIDWHGTRFRVTGLQPLEEPAPSGEMVWRTLTPVTVKIPARERDDDKEWLLPPHPSWVPSLSRNLSGKAQALHLPPDVAVTEVLAIGPRRYIAAKSTITDGGLNHAVGRAATLRVAGAPDTLAALRDWGVGNGNSSGFGWIA